MTSPCTASGMSQHVSSLLVVIICVFILTGCGSSSPGESPGPVNTPVVSNDTGTPGALVGGSISDQAQPVETGPVGSSEEPGSGSDVAGWGEAPPEDSIVVPEVSVTPEESTPSTIYDDLGVTSEGVAAAVTVILAGGDIEGGIDSGAYSDAEAEAAIASVEAGVFNE